MANDLKQLKMSLNSSIPASILVTTHPQPHHSLSSHQKEKNFKNNVTSKSKRQESSKGI